MHIVGELLSNNVATVIKILTLFIDLCLSTQKWPDDLKVSARSELVSNVKLESDLPLLPSIFAFKRIFK